MLRCHSESRVTGNANPAARLTYLQRSLRSKHTAQGHTLPGARPASALRLGLRLRLRRENVGGLSVSPALSPEEGFAL